jgi:hypothetical protein
MKLVTGVHSAKDSVIRETYLSDALDGDGTAEGHTRWNDA